MKDKAPPKKNGRPTKRSDEVINRILEGLSLGTPLTVICKPDDMPIPCTVYDWIKKDDELSKQIAHARDAGFDAIALEALKIADTPIEGVERTETPDGPRITTKDMLGHRRLQIETRLKLLAKWDRKRYGDLITQEISGPDGGPIHTLGGPLSKQDEEIILKIRDAREKLNDKKQ